ncbi:Uncharacterised protein [Bordetella pertussis]|nr:Uncharacterised protein [Bordetella pertussis]
MPYSPWPAIQAPARAGMPIWFSSLTSFCGSMPCLRSTVSRKTSGLDPCRKPMISLPLTIDQSNLSMGLRDSRKKPSVAVRPANILGLTGDSLFCT